MLSRLISLAQRMTILCAIFNLAACSTPCRQWQCQKMIACSPRFNSARLFLPPDCDNPRLELEMIRTSSGTRLYLNILFLKAPPCKEDPSRTKIEILFDNDTRPIYPSILQGGQRLLLDGEDANLLIQTLLDGGSFSIKIGRHTLTIIPDRFETCYDELMSLPIEECLDDRSCEEP